MPASGQHRSPRTRWSCATSTCWRRWRATGLVTRVLLGDHARQPAVREAGAARVGAAYAAEGDPRVARGRRAGRRDGRAGDPDGHRPRTRSDPRSRARRRRARRRLRAAAPAARAQGGLARMAAAALSRARRARDEPDPADARRQGLRQRVRHAHARRGPVRGPDRERFAKAHKRLGFGRLPPLDATQFVAPRKPSPQGELF